MKIMRMRDLRTRTILVGDRIEIGKYTATCQKVEGGMAIFMFDQCLDKAYPMTNQILRIPESYETSDLRSEFKNILLDTNFNAIRKLLIPFDNGDLLRIPTLYEMFDLTDEEFDEDEIEEDHPSQWVLMKDRRNRIAFQGGDSRYNVYWLQSAIIDPKDAFLCVDWCGECSENYAFLEAGVRPVLQVKSV